MALLAAACGGAAGADTTAQSDPKCADVVEVVVETAADGTVTVDVTVRSDDLGWEAYADRWELVSGGTVVAERVLTHPHVDEQPFTRSLRGVDMPGGPITVRAHHSTGGFCGSEMTFER